MRGHRVAFGLSLLLVAGAGTAAGDAGNGPAPGVTDSGPMAYGPAELPDELPVERRAEIQAMLDANVAWLQAEGLLQRQAEQATLFTLPVAPASGFDIAEPWGIYNFVDHDPAYPERVLDYSCGRRTYDRPDGYNHGGTDYGTFPWPWKLMQDESVSIVAAAPGTIVGKEDGYFDRSCDWNGPPYWNAVYILHADGSIAWYGHMKNGSQTGKAVGETVERGEYLGSVGSSGTSTIPHLHFEVHDRFGQLIDPYFGPCNNLNSESWWVSQEGYSVSKVLRMTTGVALPVLPACEVETPNEQREFGLPATIYFTAYFRDLYWGQKIQHEIYGPDGSLYRSWITIFSYAPYYPLAWWWWSQSFPAGTVPGAYRWRVITEEQIYDYVFKIRPPRNPRLPLAVSVYDLGPGQGPSRERVGAKVPR